MEMQITPSDERGGRKRPPTASGARTHLRVFPLVIPTVEQFPRTQDVCAATPSRARGSTCWRAATTSRFRMVLH
jgi:hypothetical protein